MPSNIELRREISVLRKHVARLEQQNNQMDLKVIQLFERIEPFFPAMSEAAKKCLMKHLEEK